jgi:transposase
LARLHRAGELVAIPIPTVAEEAVRDLCRARVDMVQDRTRARHWLSKFLLRHGRAWRGGNAWTLTHEPGCWPSVSTSPRWPPPMWTTGPCSRFVTRNWPPSRPTWLPGPTRPFADAVHRLSAYRGVTRLGALTLASEVGDWRRFPRAAAFTGFCGLVPSEDSSGMSTRRGHITKTGNAHLRTRLAWVGLGLPAPPAVGLELRQRHKGLDPAVLARAWAAQLRLCGRFRRLAARKDSKNVVVTAIARELAGFVWAEMTA